MIEGLITFILSLIPSDISNIPISQINSYMVLKVDDKLKVEENDDINLLLSKISWIDIEKYNNLVSRYNSYSNNWTFKETSDYSKRKFIIKQNILEVKIKE